MSATEAAPPPTVGGRYTLGDLIGRGGAAEVFRARDELLGREVAIKMFAAADEGSGEPAPEPPPTAAGPAGEAGEARVGAEEAGGAPAAEVVGDLEGGREAHHRREVLTLAGLSHPGLVTVYDVGEEGGRAYFVMQLIEGDTLAQRICSGPLAVLDVLALGAALADALAYIHRRGVVHRDVKPGNVLLDEEGRAHLSDFGIAAARDTAPTAAAGVVIGTASYLSPEQVRGEPADSAVDVYALGLVLIECLTGRREYPGNALEAAVARLHRRPVVPPHLPAGLAALLAGATADDPTARPTAEEIVPALRDVSREVGMAAETVLSPVLVTGPGGVGPGGVIGPAGVRGPAGTPGPAGALAVGPAAVAYGGRTDADPDATASSPARPLGRRRRRALLVAALAIAVLAVGSALAYTLVARPVAVPPPPGPAAAAPAVALPPPPPPLAAATTTPSAERATATRSRRPTTTAPTTTTTDAPLPARPAPLSPAPPAVGPTAEPAPSVVTTSPPSTLSAAPTPTSRGRARI